MSYIDNAYFKAIDLMRELSTKNGFLASKTNKDNYHRIFARDGIILGLAALASEDEELIKCFKKTLMTLGKFQGEEGEIVSNVSIKENKISYGGTTGRVDATLWYVIGIVQYVKRTADINFLQEQFDSLKKCIDILESWEFNEKGFIYVPQGGDWADEYVNEGYVLYDEVLYYRALEEYLYVLKKLGKNSGVIFKKVQTLKEMIRINFWPQKKDKDSDYIYHRGLFERLLMRKEDSFFVSSFSPGGFRNNYDAFGNALAVIFGISNKSKEEKIFGYVVENFGEDTGWMVPAFSPVITKQDSDWTILKTNFSFKFKNEPYQYHNGGLWPLTTGFTSLAFARSGNEVIAKKYLERICRAVEKQKWGFFEYLDGQNFKAKGTKHLGFSAAALVLVYCAVHKKKVFL